MLRWVWLPVVFLSFASDPAAKLEYSSPYCAAGESSTPWACGAWPAKEPPQLGRAGSITTDPDTGNRVLRATQSGSLGESPATAFKVFDAGWRAAWNADSTRFIVTPWSAGQVHGNGYWLGFDGSRMKLTGESGRFPGDFSDMQWDQSDPNLVVGLADGVAKAYNVKTKKVTTVFDPARSRWRANPWISGWGGNRVCIASGPQDTGFRIVCADRDTAKSQVIDLRSQTIDGKPFSVLFQGVETPLPRSTTIHTITLAPDGDWLAVDTHDNIMCSVPGQPKYAGTQLLLDLRSGEGHEWNIACGATHWALGYRGALMQSATPKWTPTGADGPCNSDSRGIARRTAGRTIDSSYVLTGPCSFFEPGTWAVNVHLSWTNNRGDADANRYPVIFSTTSDTGGKLLMGNEIDAMETSAPPNKGRLWRFAQTWNDPVHNQCGFLDYSSPSVSPDGRWALYPSNWRGATGPGGTCAHGTRTDVFIFELK